MSGEYPVVVIGAIGGKLEILGPSVSGDPDWDQD